MSSFVFASTPVGGANPSTPSFGFPPRPESASKKKREESSSGGTSTSSGSKIENPLLGRPGMVFGTTPQTTTTMNEQRPRDPFTPLFASNNNNNDTGIRQRKTSALIVKPSDMEDRTSENAIVSLPKFSQEDFKTSFMASPKDETTGSTNGTSSAAAAAADPGTENYDTGDDDDDHTWVLLIGVSTEAQRAEILDICRDTVGIITEQLHPADSNVAAIKFSNSYDAKRAVSHSFFVLSDGVTYCSVVPLTSSQRRILTNMNTGMSRTSVRREQDTSTSSSGTSPSFIFAPSMAGGVPPTRTDRDTLIGGTVDTRYNIRRGLMERLVAWVFGWE